MQIRCDRLFLCAGAGGTEELAASTAMLIQLANTSAPAIASVAAACANLLLDMWCE